MQLVGYPWPATLTPAAATANSAQVCVCVRVRVSVSVCMCVCVSNSVQTSFVCVYVCVRMHLIRFACGVRVERNPPIHPKSAPTVYS